MIVSDHSLRLSFTSRQPTSVQRIFLHVHILITVVVFICTVQCTFDSVHFTRVSGGLSSDSYGLTTVVYNDVSVNVCANR